MPVMHEVTPYQRAHGGYHELAVIPLSPHQQRWFPSGNIVCFTGGHIPLALLSIVILVLAVGLIPLSVAIVLGKLSKVCSPSHGCNTAKTL